MKNSIWNWSESAETNSALELVLLNKKLTFHPALIAVSCSQSIILSISNEKISFFLRFLGLKGCYFAWVMRD